MHCFPTHNKQHANYHPNGWKKNTTGKGKRKDSQRRGGKGKLDIYRPNVSRKVVKIDDKFFGRSIRSLRSSLSDEQALKIQKKKMERLRKFMKSGQTIEIGKKKGRGGHSKQNLRKKNNMS
jgi:hypothetical protein